jgi:hypothetical protein
MTSWSLIWLALNALLSLVYDMSMFNPLFSPTIRHISPLYTDDLVVFLVSAEQDIQLVRAVMEIFAGVLGLNTNISKCQFTPIRCSEDQVALV